MHSARTVLEGASPTMNLSSISKSVAAVIALSLAASGIGCAAPTEAPPQDHAFEKSATTSRVQQPNMVVQALSGIVGVVNVTGMVQMQVKYGKQMNAADVYDETLRLQADIAALRATFDTQVNTILVGQQASQVRGIESAITESWNMRRDVIPGREEGFYAEIRSKDALTFSKLAELDAVLMGDSMGSGLFDLTAQSMRKVSSDGMAREDVSNVLGELVLHLRLVQLQGFELLSQAYAQSATYTPYFDIAKKRAELFTRLDAQEARFFDLMGQYNAWAIGTKVRWWSVGAPGQGEAMRNQFARTFWNYETVMKNWNTVPDGFSLDVEPRVNVVSASYGSLDVSGSIATMCNRKGACNETFSSGALGLPDFAPSQAQLDVTYRCEGIPGTKTASIPNVNGGKVNLSCSRIDAIVGAYTGSSNMYVTVTRLDDQRALWTGSDKKLWSLTTTADPTKLALNPCYIDETKSLYCQKWNGGEPEWTVVVGRDNATSLPQLARWEESFVRTTPRID